MTTERIIELMAKQDAAMRTAMSDESDEVWYAACAWERNAIELSRRAEQGDIIAQQEVHRILEEMRGDE